MIVVCMNGNRKELQAITGHDFPVTGCTLRLQNWATYSRHQDKELEKEYK